MGNRADSDEAYIITLCDETLDLIAIRQHKFYFLLGDMGKNGKKRRLSVDAYYPSLSLVIEYHEKQHNQAVALFDKPNRMTISGVHRGNNECYTISVDVTCFHNMILSLWSFHSTTSVTVQTVSYVEPKWIQ